MWLDKLICLVSMKFEMNLWEEKIPLEGKGRRGKGKIRSLEGALRLTYRGSTIDVYDEAGSSDQLFE